MVKIAFDVDGTLIKKGPTGADVPVYKTLRMLHLLLEVAEIYVWSGSGLDYAQRWCEKLGIDDMVTVVPKGSFKADLTFDDEDVELGKVNIKV